MRTRRDFLQFAVVAGSAVGAVGANITRAVAQQSLSEDDLLSFDDTGTITLLHVTDLHAQLEPVYFRSPDTNIGVGDYAGVPPHLVAGDMLAHFGLEPGSALAYAHSMLDYESLARAYGRLGGLDRTAHLVNAIRAERGENNVLLLDGGDTWQGSYTSLKTNGQDMVDCMALLKPDAMVGHWEFTLGAERVLEIIESMDYPFLASNIVDTDWEEPVFESTKVFDVGGSRVAVIGQAMPYTPIANPSWMFPEWSFGIRPDVLQANVDEARAGGAEVVVLLSHNGFDVDRKLAGVVSGIDVILTGHTHDAIPEAIQVGSTLLLASGSHGKFLGRVDLSVRNGRVVDHASTLIPVLSDVVTPDPTMRAAIDDIRAPYVEELSRVLTRTDSLLYRRGNFNGTWDDVICEGLRVERDAELSLSPGFRWGTTLLPGSDVTVEDLYTQTSMSYPEVYRLEFTGQQLHEILEDVCDNLFNQDPFFQQGGDMVRVGGLDYNCEPAADMGSRITDMRISDTGKPLDMKRSYVVAGWASVNEGVEGPPVYDLMENYLASLDSISVRAASNVTVKTR